MDERPIAVIVDDSKPFLMYLSLLLNRMNLEVLPVTNAPEALEVSRVTQPHLVIMDLVMPEMDGLEALRTIRNDKELAGLSVIMVSGYRQKHLQWEALSLGCVDVLEKPIDLRRLHKAVQDCNPYPSGRRRYLRVPFEEQVILHNRNESIKVASVTLSERGIFLHMKDPLPKRTPVDVEIPLPSGEILRAGGSVIYAKTTHGHTEEISPGVAVKFDRLSSHAKESLSELVEELLVADLDATDMDPVVESD